MAVNIDFTDVNDILRQKNLEIVETKTIIELCIKCTCGVSFYYILDEKIADVKCDICSKKEILEKINNNDDITLDEFVYIVKQEKQLSFKYTKSIASNGRFSHWYKHVHYGNSCFNRQDPMYDAMDGSSNQDDWCVCDIKECKLPEPSIWISERDGYTQNCDMPIAYDLKQMIEAIYK